MKKIKTLVSIFLMTIVLTSMSKTNNEKVEIAEKLDKICWEIASNYANHFQEEHGLYWIEVEDMVYEIYDDCQNWDDIEEP